jgi:AcrR family transcriptional regulator
VTQRAAPLSPENRRAAILAAAVPVIKEHGRSTTTKQIALAAGIAEGTIFRVFTSKEELFDAAFEVTIDPQRFLADLKNIDPQQPLVAKLTELTTILHQRFTEIFTLMSALGIPPGKRLSGQHPEDWRQQAEDLVVTLLEPDATQFRVPVLQVGHTLRMLTFSACHPHISQTPQQLTPEQIVDVVLHGTLTQGAPLP